VLATSGGVSTAAVDTPRVVPHATCLGCGCACDDIEVVVVADRIVEARRACPLGVAWFGDGSVPVRAVVEGGDVTGPLAIDAVARLLLRARRPLVYLAPELSCEAQREAVGLADGLRALLDTVSTDTVLPSILAMQERGRASATLGEVRNRADVLVWWGVDPDARYPRYPTRYAPQPSGLQVPEGRRSRRVIAVDVGEARGPVDADVRIAVSPAEEAATLTALRALLGTGAPAPAADEGAAWANARAVTAAIGAARYVVVAADAEPSPGRDPARAAALVAWTQALNGPTRAALSTLRAGGNRSGADAVLTSQTGYPTAVDFSRGYPRYVAHHGATARMARGEIDAVLIVGLAAGAPAAVRAGPTLAVIGPRASEAAGALVAIDTGVAGIHVGGTALRLDDVPLPLRPALDHVPDPASVLRALRGRVVGLRRHAEGGA
jgi:formylmethanofuran dehydrogenase subunit B